MEKSNLSVSIPESVAGGELGPGKEEAKLETDGVGVGIDGPAAGTVPWGSVVGGGGLLASKTVQVYKTIACNALSTSECLTVSISVRCVRRVVLDILHYLLDRLALI